MPPCEYTVKSYQSTIQFWTFLVKGHSTQRSNFSFINSLKIFECATNWDSAVYTAQNFKVTISAAPNLKTPQQNRLYPGTFVK